MTNKIIIDGIDVSKCKYKIQSSENFKTKPYCSILNKFCEDISFVCDKNCQVFEDLKQLARAKEEIEKWKHQADLGSDTTDRLAKELEDKTKENEELKKQLDKYLNQEEEEIRNLNLNNKLDDILQAISKADAQVEKESSYRQALDKIKGICQIEEENNRYSCPSSFRKIQDIINKAKE